MKKTGIKVVCNHCQGRQWVRRFFFFKRKCSSCRGYGHLIVHPVLNKVDETTTIRDGN